MIHKDYYIYAYLRKEADSVSGKKTPYYIGYGRLRRAWNLHKNILVPDDDRFIKILCENLSESEAHTKEIEYIKKCGRIDIQTGILENKTAGGQGFVDYDHSQYKKIARDNHLAAGGIRQIGFNVHPKTKELTVNYPEKKILEFIAEIKILRDKKLKETGAIRLSKDLGLNDVLKTINSRCMVYGVESITRSTLGRLLQDNYSSNVQFRLKFISDIEQKLKSENDQLVKKELILDKLEIERKDRQVELQSQKDLYLDKLIQSIESHDWNSVCNYAFELRVIDSTISWMVLSDQY